MEQTEMHLSKEALYLMDEICKIDLINFVLNDLKTDIEGNKINWNTVLPSDQLEADIDTTDANPTTVTLNDSSITLLNIVKEQLNDHYELEGVAHNRFAIRLVLKKYAQDHGIK